MATYLITGASRGIGLELTRQLLQLPPWQVSQIFALSRSSSSSTALQDLIDANSSRVIHIIASVDDSESVNRAVGEVEAKLGGGSGQGLDVLVNNAGVQEFSPGGTRYAGAEQLARVFDVNVVGPQRVIAGFLPLLERGREKKVVNVSSSMGSIALAEKYRCAPNQAYKISKAALHMLSAQYALDHAEAGFTFLCVSPGWLKTDLGGQQADLEVEVGVSELKRIILESSKEKNGKFVNICVPGQENARGQYDGGEIPW